MLRALRRSRRNLWLAVLALLTTLPASFGSWHDLGDDPLCNPAIVVHDHAAHRVSADTTSPAAPDHCVVCHWLQTLRGTTEPNGCLAPPSTSAQLPTAAPVRTVARILEGRFGRAPPLS
jgi:hypothetical protein